MNLPTLSARAFTAMQNLNVAQLAECSADEIRPLLPSLVRMSLLSSFDTSRAANERGKQIQSLLVGIEVVNQIVSFLQVDYHELEIDVKKEQQLRQKSGNSAQDSGQFHGLQNGVALGFERADVTRKVRIVLSELFYIQAQIFEQNQLQATRGQLVAANESIVKQSELFDNDIYLEEITIIICIALAELPSLFNIQEVIETLLYCNAGSTIICWVVANTPDSFREVVAALVSATADEDTAEGRLRSAALSALCSMSPGQALPTRAMCMEQQRMPSLMLRLSLGDPHDLLAFVSGLLLGNDAPVRTWFLAYLRAGQKRKQSALQAVRDELQQQLQRIVAWSGGDRPLPDELVVLGGGLMRFYCALRGLAGIKFSDDEIQLLVDLVTSKPPATAAGIRFVSLGLCMLIACPSLIGLPANELKSIEWVHWLCKEESYFEPSANANGTTNGASFGEMLLLMAIHFHSNQVSAISELVCATLGMKIPLRQNNTVRMKHIFTQEIFTEQVVCAHAVRVPVTHNLNASIAGYLPVHCIQQLLKSRAFTKHKVPIKSWIYRQICASRTPLHPVLPALIEAYVVSIVAPQAKGPLEHTHKPLSEDEIMRVFQRCSVIGGQIGGGAGKSNAMDTSSGSGGVVVDESATGSTTVQHGQPQQPGLTAQLLLLYYLLLYEDMRLSNMSAILAVGRKIKSYGTEFLSELPIKLLLQQAQIAQDDYGGLFSPLMRLLVTHYPHLCLVDDWIEEEQIAGTSSTNPNRTLGPKPAAAVAASLQPAQFRDAFEALAAGGGGGAASVIRLLKLLLRMPPTAIWPHAEQFVQYVRLLLDAQVPRAVQELYRQVWTRLNSVLPRRLNAMTIAALMPDAGPERKFRLAALAQSSASPLLDPLDVLRCDSRVFRCAPVLAVVLRILQAGLAESKCQLTRHMLDKPLPLLEKAGQLQSETEREELRQALVAAQDTAAVQLLLEVCEETAEERVARERQGGDGNCLSWQLREVRAVICSYVHQVFIAESSLARLLHFQGYSRQLLPMTVRGIPSIHICIDFITELISMPEMDKQVFAIDLTSHLSVRYALPSTFNAAKLCLTALLTLIGVLPADIRVEMFRTCLPCVVRFGEAFPPLLDECLLLLMQMGRLAESQTALGRTLSLPQLTSTLGGGADSRLRAQSGEAQAAESLVEEVRETYARLLDRAVLRPRIY